MKRTFKYNQFDTIPPLSWLMKITNDEDILVKHGKFVEHKDDFFVSGVWDGNFEKGDFISARYSCCTGAKLNNDAACEIIVTTPSHPQEAVFSILQGDMLIISNSLPFLLSETNKNLNVNYHQYEADFCSIIYGEKDAVTSIPLQDDYRVHLHRNVNIIINSSEHNNKFNITEVSRNIHCSFTNYDDYCNFLHSILKGIVENATDKNRLFSYGMITTISKGYDAAAVSVLAADLGCQEAITMRVPQNDNGKNIALKLGYKVVHEIERDAYVNNNKLLEAETVASGCVTGMIFEAYENICSGKLIFMGTRGDSVWEKLLSGVNDSLAFPHNGYAQADLSPSEHLFRINSIIIHVPLIGANSWPEIAKISNSEEMKPWSVGGMYDRPIARRLVEEKGVLRNEFGTQKLGGGISFHFNTLTSIKRKMSPTSYNSLLQYKADNKPNWIKQLIYNVSFVLSEFPVYYNYFMYKSRIRLFINERACGHKSSPTSNLLILWGINEIKKRYR